jgi:hypothetical protein
MTADGHQHLFPSQSKVILRMTTSEIVEEAGLRPPSPARPRRPRRRTARWLLVLVAVLPIVLIYLASFVTFPHSPIEPDATSVLMPPSGHTGSARIRAGSTSSREPSPRQE